MRGYYLTILFTLILFPSYTSASVSINEVAWMGGVDSANHEWIELYNEGTESISVDGWVLGDGLKLSINLSGVINSNSYAVLERTSEDSAPGTAFLIYTGALVNGGATLVLRDESGGIRDQVNGGGDWINIGGDNVTKETAQYTTSGWVTDAPTPGRQNASGRVEVVADTTANTTSGTNTTSGSSNKTTTVSVNLKNTETKLTLTPNIQSIAYVNQKVPMSVVASGLTEKLQHLVDYSWNFGDGNVDTTRKVEHTYLYPGSYVITVQGKKDKVEQTVRKEITVLPVDFSITLNDYGDVQIHNDAPYDVDISGYLLKGLKNFIFAERTIILPRATITIPAYLLGGQMGNYLVALYDTRRVLVTSSYPRHLLTTMGVEDSPEVSVVTRTTQAPIVSLSDFRIGVTAVEAADEVVISESEVIIVPAEAAPLKEKNEVRWPYLMLIALLLLAVFGIFASKNKEADTFVTK